MKITKDDKQELRKCAKEKDWESYHEKFDDLMKKRLRELDPEYIESLVDEAEDAVFWYA